MTLDLAKIKSDAEIIASRCDMLLMTLPVRDVLKMVAEIERGERLFDQSERALDRVNAMWHRRWLARIGEPYPIPSLTRDEEFDQLKAENEALRKLCFEMRGSVECGNVHHCKGEQHEHDEPCKVLARIDAAMAKERP